VVFGSGLLYVLLMTVSMKTAPELLTPARILETAREQVRRHGHAKTNIVDIAKALGTSHTTIYRHFRSKTEVFDALVEQTMTDERELALEFTQSDTLASERLLAMVLALHRRKRERLKSDPEVFDLYRRVLEERQDLIRNYATAMTRILAEIVESGVIQGEFETDSVALAAEVIRDAVTVYVHPAHVQAAANAGVDLEPAVARMVACLVTALKSGVRLDGSSDEP
jgi:AcrR family transcriptional regulator